MSDKQLRELERRWKETGSVEDEADYLLERMRAGELEEKQLRLALYLGHPAAQIVLNEADPPTMTVDEDAALELRRFSEEALLRGGLAASYRALKTHPTELGVGILDLINCISTLFFFPSSVRLYQRYQELANSVRSDIADKDAEPYYGVDGEVLLEGLRAVTSFGRVALAKVCDVVHAHLAYKHRGEIQHWEDAITEECDEDKVSDQIFLKGHDALRDLGNHVIAVNDVNRAISTELTAWALGYSDPLRERAEELYKTETP